MCIRDREGTGTLTFWTEGYRTPTFQAENVKNLLSPAVNRGDLRRFNYNTTVAAGALPGRRWESSRRSPRPPSGIRTGIIPLHSPPVSPRDPRAPRSPSELVLSQGPIRPCFHQQYHGSVWIVGWLEFTFNLQLFVQLSTNLLKYLLKRTVKTTIINYWTVNKMASSASAALMGSTIHLI